MYIFLIKKIFFSFLFKNFFLLFSFKIPYYSPITPQLLFSYIFMIFLIREKQKFFSFFFLVFVSYFLLKSSNTSLLCLNFHFHFTVTLQKKKETERSPIFKPNFIYVSKFFGFLFLNIVFQRV